jgi:hypothetical protein
LYAGAVAAIVLNRGSQSHRAQQGTHVKAHGNPPQPDHSNAANFVPTGQPNHGVHGDIEFFINGNIPYVPFTDGRITAGHYSMSTADGSAGEAVFSMDMTKLRNSGDYLREATPGDEVKLFNNNLVKYHLVDFILGRWHAGNPQEGLSSAEMAGAIQLAIWGITNGIFDNGNQMPRPYNGAGHGIDGVVLDRMVQQANDIRGYTLAHHAAWFLKEADTHTVNISAPVSPIQPGQSITATAILLAEGAPDTSPNGAQITFNVAGSGKFATPKTVGVNGAGKAAVKIRATGPGTIVVNAQITSGTDFFDGVQGLSPVTYGPQGQIYYIPGMQTMAFSLHQQRASSTPSLKIPVAAPPTPRPTPAPKPPVRQAAVRGL